MTAVWTNTNWRKKNSTDLSMKASDTTEIRIDSPRRNKTWGCIKYKYPPCFVSPAVWNQSTNLHIDAISPDVATDSQIHYSLPLIKETNQKSLWLHGEHTLIIFGLFGDWSNPLSEESSKDYILGRKWGALNSLKLRCYQKMWSSLKMKSLTLARH